MADEMDQAVEITEAEVQRLLLALRRSQRPMTLDDLVELLRSEG